ncbi:MAG TPA: LysR family transcriptional regulator [Kofleriaceae bacterium]|nr:LysR family transcriptional regulator [Kofleriaceae bacterium]
MVDWDDLRYVLAVRRGGSLNAAARALGVDKATVSRRIAAAEDALGVRLFDRRPEGYHVTPHGERVLSSIGQIEDTVASMVSDLSDARGDANGVVYLSVPQFFASRVLLPALPPFRARHPGIDLVVNASSSVVNVARREAEVGLRNVKPDQLSVTVKRVGRLAMALYASKAYLAKRGAPKTPAEIAQHELVGWENAFTYAAAFRWIDDSGARVAVRVNDAAVLCDAVAAHLGIAALPCILGEERAGLVRLETFGTSRDDIYAVAPGELRRSGRVRAVIELIAGVWRANAARLTGTD